MKIDFYISSLSGGGAEKVLTTLAKELANRGNEVSIISLEKRPQFYQVAENVHLFKYDNNNSKNANIKDMRDIKSHMKKSNADISISFLNRCNLLVLMAGMFTKRKIVVCDRNNPLKEHSLPVFWLSSLIYLRANRVMVQTNQIKSFYWKCLQKKIEVIENPIDTEYLDSQLEEGVEREKVILSMGRLEKQKDFKTLINAFTKIAAKYPDWRLKIFGHGDMKDELQTLIDSNKMENQITLCGRTQKPYNEMRKASIFVLSSFYEGFPNVLCEAMYAGDLCISSDCVSGPRELIKHGENGWLFEIGDEANLTELIEYCIVHEKIMPSIRKNAEKTVERLQLDNNIFLWNEMIRNVVE